MWAYSFRVVVGPDAIDELEHVNNVEYLRWAERAGREHMESVGVPMASLVDQGVVFVARRHEIDYLAPGFLGDEIEIRTRVAAMGGARSEREVEFVRGETVLARTRTQWVYVDLASMRPRRMPEAILAAFGLAAAGT